MYINFSEYKYFYNEIKFATNLQNIRISKKHWLRTIDIYLVYLLLFIYYYQLVIKFDMLILQYFIIYLIDIFN